MLAIYSLLREQYCISCGAIFVQTTMWLREQQTIHLRSFFVVHQSVFMLCRVNTQNQYCICCSDVGSNLYANQVPCSLEHGCHCSLNIRSKLATMYGNTKFHFMEGVIALKLRVELRLQNQLKRIGMEIGFLIRYTNVFYSLVKELAWYRPNGFNS